MKPSAPLLFLLLPVVLCSTAHSGAIKGTIRASAPSTDSSSESNGDSYQSRRYKFLEQIDYSSLVDFVVSIDEIEKPGDPNSPRASVAQRDGAFVPHVTPVVAGAEIAWPNRDEIYHNVFSMSESRQFDLGMYKSSEDAKSLVFEKPGQVDVFCAIHSQMHCIVLVLPNPWFSKSDRKGRYEIKDVPAGTYRLKAWHERLPTKYIDITVPEEGVVDLDIEMGLADLPKI